MIDGPIQSAFVRGKGSGGGKKSRRPQYPLRHSGHGENGSKATSTWNSAIPATIRRLKTSYDAHGSECTRS